MSFKNFIVFSISIAIFFSYGNSYAMNPLASDSRIRTMVYNENEVFQMITEFGYQSNIEFSKNEKILTLSIGDPSSFKVTPSKNRLFVKAMRNDSHTNMTVITTKHSYQFELSSDPGDDSDLIYVMRFFYPDRDVEEYSRAKHKKPMRKQRAPSFPPAFAPAGQASAPANISNAAGRNQGGRLQGRVPSFVSKSAATARKDLVIPEISADNLISQGNSSYSMKGDTKISPVEIFDNGRTTFFKFSAEMEYVPSFYVVNPDGSETSIDTRSEGKFIAIDGVHSKLALRSGPSVICIANNNSPAMTLTSR